jgi:hypothetical protein
MVYTTCNMSQNKNVESNNAKTKMSKTKMSKQKNIEGKNVRIIIHYIIQTVELWTRDFEALCFELEY